MRERTVKYLVHIYNYDMIQGEFGVIGYLEYERNLGDQAKFDEVQAFANELAKIDEEYKDFTVATLDDITKLIDLINFKTKKRLKSLGSKDGFESFYEYLRQEFKEGKKEFRISFLGIEHPTHFLIHPMNKDGKTLDLVLTHTNVI